MGAEKMSELSDISLELAEKCIEDLWTRCPVLKDFVDKKSQWAMDHPGYVQSALGDVLEMGEDDGEDRAARLGINQFIQNYSSVSLADGFLRCIEPSIHHNDIKIPKVQIRPLGVIHDSSQFYFTTTYLFRMKEYYTRHLSEYMYKTHGIYYDFDLELGTNFYDVADVNQIDDHHIEFTGNYVTLKELVDKCRKDGLKFKITSLTDKDGNPIAVNGFEFGPEFKPKLYNSIVREFLDYELYAKFNEDKSKFKMIFEELPENEAYGMTVDLTAKPKVGSWKAPF